MALPLRQVDTVDQVWAAARAKQRGHVSIFRLCMDEGALIAKVHHGHGEITDNVATVFLLATLFQKLSHALYASSTILKVTPHTLIQMETISAPMDLWLYHDF